MFELTDSLKTNIEKIDNQHAELIRMCNDLQELCDLPEYIDRYDEIVKLVNELKQYTEEHFTYEEQFLAEIGYRKRFTHHMVHHDFVTKINELSQRDIDADQNDYLLILARTVAEWIIIHIAKEDMMYAEFYHNQK